MFFLVDIDPCCLVGCNFILVLYAGGNKTVSHVDRVGALETNTVFYERGSEQRCSAVFPYSTPCVLVDTKDRKSTY